MGIGGDPVNGTSFVDALALFQADPDTDGVLMMGEIGGNAEEQAADIQGVGQVHQAAGGVHRRSDGPARQAHGPRRRDHLGGSGKAADKIAALEGAGIRVAKSPADMGATLQAASRGERAG